MIAAISCIVAAFIGCVIVACLVARLVLKIIDEVTNG